MQAFSVKLFASLQCKAYQLDVFVCTHHVPTYNRFLGPKFSMFVCTSKSSYVQSWLSFYVQKYLHLLFSHLKRSRHSSSTWNDGLGLGEMEARRCRLIFELLHPESLRRIWRSGLGLVEMGSRIHINSELLYTESRRPIWNKKQERTISIKL